MWDEKALLNACEWLLSRKVLLLSRVEHTSFELSTRWIACFLDSCNTEFSCIVLIQRPWRVLWLELRDRDHALSNRRWVELSPLLSDMHLIAIDTAFRLLNFLTAKIWTLIVHEIIAMDPTFVKPPAFLSMLSHSASSPCHAFNRDTLVVSPGDLTIEEVVWNWLVHRLCSHHVRSLDRLFLKD